MKFSMNDAQRQSYNREKFLPGLHVCEVVNVRMESGFRGTFFKVDLKVLEGPTGVDAERTRMMDPDGAKSSPKMSKEKARSLDIGKIQACVAAMYGYEANKAGVITDAIFAASLASDSKPSPLAGRKLSVNAREYAPGKVAVDFAPHGERATEPPAAVAPPPAPSAPAVVAAPAFPPAGWTVHPENSSYFFKGSEVLSEAQLRAL